MKIRPLPEIAVERAQQQCTNSESFELVTTLRYDPELAALTRHIPIALQESFEQRFFLANLHYQRLKQAARTLGWDVDNFNQQKVYDALQAVTGDDPLAVRLAVKKCGSITVTTRPTPARKNLFIGVSNGPSSILVYDVFINSEPVSASSLLPVKSNSRDIYDKVRAQFDVQPSNSREVLLYNEQRNVMEATVCAVAVAVGDDWICPRLESGGVSSVMRSLLLDLGFVKEGDISVNDLTEGQDLILFNGVIGVVRGRISKA